MTADLDPDSVRAIAKKDFQDAARSKVLWALAVLFVVFLGGMALVFVWFEGVAAQQDEQVAAADLIGFLQTPVAWLFPLIGLLLGYKSLAGEVDSGSSKILLSLPHSRLDAVVGKLIGRTAVLWLALFVGLAVASAVVVALYDEFAIAHLAAFSVLSMLLGAAYVSVGVAISASTKSSGTAAIGVVAAFAFFYFVFDSIRMGIYYLSTGEFFPFPGEEPTWYEVYERLGPGGAYTDLLVGVLPDGSPFLSAWAALVILFAWIVVPIAIGYLRFERLDL